jgi:TolB protein
MHFLSVLNRYFLKFVITVLIFVIILLFVSCSDDDTTIIIPPPPPPSGYSTIDYVPSWSPDGHTIAYLHLDTSAALTGIYLIDTNGTNKRLLIGYMARNPDFSPDGIWITFHNGQIFKIKINGDSLMQLTNGGSNYYPSWSPDGDWIAYDSDYNDPTGSIVIWKVKTDTSIRRDISQHGTGEWRMSSWSPDGKKIVHQRYIVGAGGLPEIVIMDSSGQNSIRLTNNNNDDFYPKYSPNGQKIIFTQKHETSINFQIYTINIDGTNLTKLTDTQGFSADYSPDGEKIVYCDSSPGNGRLWIMNKDGTNKKQLTFP